MFSKSVFKGARLAATSLSVAQQQFRRRFASMIARGAPTFAHHGEREMSKGQQIFWVGLGGAATFGILSMCAKGLSAPNMVEGQFSSDVRSRLLATYGHVAGGLASTGVFAFGMFHSGLAFRMMQMNPIALMVGTLAATIGAMVVTQSINYQENPMAKHAAWMVFNAAIAASLCPLGALGGPLLWRAALGTGAIIGSLSAVAASAPSDQFLQMGGMLSIGLGVVIAASLGQMVFPASSLLMNVSLYGGLGLFSLFTLYDTQLILARCRDTPDGQFDPINASFGLYMDTINIFIRMAIILSGGKRK